MDDNQKIWLRKLSKLHPNISRAKGTGAERFAPHKPLLLLAMIDLAGHTMDLSNPMSLSAGLRVRFLESWSIVAPRWRSRPNVSLPFHYLSSQGFWKALQDNGTPSRTPETTTLIELHPEFLGLLGSKVFRGLAQNLLIQSWFPPEEQVGLLALYGLKAAEPVLRPLVAEEASALAETGRDARFRIQVVTGYIYTCALTGYTLTAAKTGATLVEAAHIADFATSRNNDPKNGLALTPDSHWSFDEGLWTIDKSLRIVVASQMFSDWSPEGISLRSYHGRSLYFHAHAKLRPHELFLEKHRSRFVG